MIQIMVEKWFCSDLICKLSFIVILNTICEYSTDLMLIEGQDLFYIVSSLKFFCSFNL